jgi:hypothetical protein
MLLDNQRTREVWMVLMSGRFRLKPAILVALLAGVLSSEARAQSGVGFTGGASIDPEQVYVGVFWQSPAIGGNFRIRPGLDGGFGNDLRLGTINIDFTYSFPLGQSPWRFVTGGGPAIVLINYSNDGIETGTEVTAGGSYIFGFAHEEGFFAEFRVGGGNVPSLKMGAGWVLNLR